MADLRLIYLDTETTGMAEPVGVCDCAFIELDPETFEIIGRHSSLIDPQRPIQASASGIHNITDDMVADAPTLQEWFELVLGDPFKDTETLIMAAHNSKYDFPLVAPHLPENTLQLCTLKLARLAYPDAEDHKLSTLKYLFNFGRSISHEALADVEDGVKLLQKIARDLDMGLEELMAYQHQPRTLKTMPFGKHKGVPIEEIDAGYVKWYLRQPEQDPDLLHTLKIHFPRFF